jgi:hypothetical protein
LDIFLNFFVEEETKGIIDEFHKGIYEGHHAWKATSYKILRASYYCPKLFSEVNGKVLSCKGCYIFAGKQNLTSLPLVPIKVESHFQEWPLDFIGEIYHASSTQHMWILTTT